MFSVCHASSKDGYLKFTEICDGIEDALEAINLCNAYRRIEEGNDKFYVLDEAGSIVDELKVERENIAE